MTLRAGRYTELLCILFFAIVIIAVITIVSLPSPITADPRALASGDAAISVIVEAEQATLAGPVTVGRSSGASYVQFGSTAPASVFQPTAPYYATFYYPWYGAPVPDGRWSYWTGQGSQPPNTWFSHYLPDPLPNEFDPSRELYSSHDANLLYWQFGKMAEAKIEVAISSWWGQGDRTDDNFGFILQDAMKRSDNPYPNLRWALYYEEESNSDPSVAQIVGDLDYVADQYAAEPGHVKIGGRPVILVDSAEGDGVDMAKRWHEAKALAKLPFYVVLKVFSGYKMISPQPDGWHQSGPAMRAIDHAPYSFSVSPGFWYDGAGEAPRLGRDLAEFRNAVSNMVAADATWKLVTTWNEWGEGTAVEPGEQVVFDSNMRHDVLDPAGAPFKNAYVDALREFLPPLEEGTERVVATVSNVTPAPAVTPTPGGAVPPSCPPPPADMGVATLNVDFPAAGSYYIWSLMLAANSAGGAFWVQIDDACATRVVGGGSGVAAWEWVNYQDGEPDSPIQEPLARGTHTVRLFGIDAGVKVDKLLFTTDPNPVLPDMPPAHAGDHLFLPLVSS